MKTKPKYFYLHAVLLVLGVCIFLGINNYIYLKRCVEPFIGDQIEFLTSGAFHFQHKSYIFYLSQMLRGPGIFIVAGLLYNIFPVTEITAINANLFFAFFGFLSVYLIAFKFTQNKKNAFDAVLLFLFYPLVFGLSRYFLCEFALMSTVAFFVFALLYSHSFKNKRYSVLTGIILGLGVLSKESFYLFAIGPLLWQFLVLDKKNLNRSQKKNIIICFSVTVLFLSMWFLHSPISILKDGFYRVTQNANNSDIAFFSFKNIFFYLFTLADFSISPFFMILFFISLRALKKFKNKGLLIFWIIVPYLIFLFFPWKLARYIAPVCPAIAIVTALYLNTLSGRAQMLIRFIYIVFGLVQFFTLTHFNVFNLPENYFIGTATVSKIFGIKADKYQEDFLITQPNKKNTGAKIVLENIAKNNTKKTKPLVCQILNEYNSKITGDMSLTLAERYKNYTHIMHPLSTAMGLYNASLGYDFAIVYVFVDENKNWKYWEGTSDIPYVKDKNQFDFILSYNPLFLENLNYTLIKENTKPPIKTFYLFKQKSYQLESEGA